MSNGSSRQCGGLGDIDDEVLEIGARLAEGPSPRLIQTAFRRELEDQVGLCAAMNRVDLAHTVVMAESGIVPALEAKALFTALVELRNQPADFAVDPAHGDLYTNREAWLHRHGYPADWLGAGRARREAATTAYHLRVRDALLDLAGALAAANTALTAQAYRYRYALMPDYTYLQAAQPTTFGHYLLGFAWAQLRDFDRLQALYLRVNLSPAGCGSTNGSRLPQQRERLAALLGFDAPVIHARDAMWQADVAIETAALLSALLVNLDRLSEDLQIFATAEFALIDFDDRHARASKIMPQKKNPFALVHIRGLANAMIGTLSACAASGRTPSGQPDNRLRNYHAIPQAIEETTAALELLAEVVELFSFNERQARSRLDNSFAAATDLAEMLVLNCGVGFREAHRLVGYLVRCHLPNGSFKRLMVTEIAEAAQKVLGRCITLPEETFLDALDPAAAITARAETGGAAPAQVEAMIDHCRSVVSRASQWVSEQGRHLEAAEKNLQQSIADYLQRECGKSSLSDDERAAGLNATHGTRNKE